MAKFGVFCGTFNPIHWGHLFMAECAREQAGLDKIMFITSPNPPHRKDDLLEAEHRHELVIAALADNPVFEASTLELVRTVGGAPSYTVDTLLELKALLTPEFGDSLELSLIIGQDNLNYIGQWHRADDIFRLAQLVVAPRVKQPAHAGAPTVEKLPPPEARVLMLDLPLIPVSSSEIRNRLRAGRSVLYMVPTEVAKILRDKRYYL